ncbi:MAG: Kdo hydroxylase family protein [Betaproteobacteria bacterium]|jgi:hypothetical protein|nr:Kdo hydroxylase family protein [Betaproteobacteria bacterium]
MSDVISFAISDWNLACPSEAQERATRALEAGKVLLFPQLRFPIENGEAQLLSPIAAGRAKNVSLDPASGRVRGSDADPAELKLLQNMMTRWATLSKKLVCQLLPHYAMALQQARTSYRPVEVAGRPTSWRKDDTRLHVDSFPSSPVHGRRILRVFTNLHPQGVTRKWRLGEPFEALAQHFVPSIPGPLPGSSFVLNALGVTKSRRSAYDHFMLQLHDRMKADADYQAKAVRESFEFPSGVTWMVYTDQVSHAAMGGRYALEQTFLLPVEAMRDPARSPLRVLEKLRGHALA